jgi:hypothetical protein
MTVSQQAGHHWLSVYDIEIEAARSLALPTAAPRFCYLRSGMALIKHAGTEHEMQPDTGMFVVGDVSMAGAGLVWMFELSSRRAVSPNRGPIALVLSQLLNGDIAGERILRADRVESPPGSVTPRHRHQGPGLRRLMSGRLMAEVGDRIERIADGQAWYESGREPVVGTNINDSNNAFVRVMVLPAALAGGRTSFLPETPADALKARILEQKLFGELTVLLD